MTKSFGWTRTALEVLVFLRGRFLGSLVFTSPEITIGRSPDSMVCLEHANVSRQHAVLRFDGVACELEDVGSLSGIQVNGRKVTLAGVRPTDEIGIGPFRLRLALHRSSGESAHGRFSAQSSSSRRRDLRSTKSPANPASESSQPADDVRSPSETEILPLPPGIGVPADVQPPHQPPPVAEPATPSADASARHRGGGNPGAPRIVRNLPKPLSGGRTTSVPPARVRSSRPAPLRAMYPQENETTLTNVERTRIDGAPSKRAPSVPPDSTPPPGGTSSK